MFATSLLSALLVAASLGVIDPQQAAAPPALDITQLKISTPTYGADGKIYGASASGFRGQPNQPLVLYAHSGKTLCASSSAQTDLPGDAGFGWRLEITSVKNTFHIAFDPQGRVNPAATARALTFRVQWTLFWDHGEVLSGAGSHSAVVTLHPGEHILLDYLSASLDALGPLRQKALDDLNQAAMLRARQGGTPTPAAPQGGGAALCDAIGMGLELSLDPPKESRLVETDLWLVHHLPDGTEQSQHQVLRTRMAGSTDYFFDALKNVPTKNGSVAITGKVAPYTGADGKLHMKLDIAASYIVNPAPELKIQGGSGYDTIMAPGEVLSFNLPVLGANNGSMNGHKFSLRIRTTEIK